MYRRFSCAKPETLFITSNAFHWPEHGHMAHVTTKDAGKCSPPRRERTRIYLVYSGLYRKYYLGKGERILVSMWIV